MCGNGVYRHDIAAAFDAEREEVGIGKGFVQLHAGLAVTESIFVEKHTCSSRILEL